MIMVFLDPIGKALVSRYIYVRTCACVCECMCVSMCGVCDWVCVHIFVDVGVGLCVHDTMIMVSLEPIGVARVNMYIMYACKYIYINVCIYICTYIYMYIYIHIYVCKYIYIYIYIHTHAHIHVFVGCGYVCYEEHGLL